MLPWPYSYNIQNLIHLSLYYRLNQSSIQKYFQGRSGLKPSFQLKSYFPATGWIFIHHPCQGGCSTLATSPLQAGRYISQPTCRQPMLEGWTLELLSQEMKHLVLLDNCHHPSGRQVARPTFSHGFAEPLPSSVFKNGPTCSLFGLMDNLTIYIYPSQCIM